MIIFIYGDSISLGLWDENGGWADRLKKDIFAKEVANNLKTYNEVYNLGIDGNFTRQIVARFEEETKARLWPDEKYMFIFATGTNDSLINGNGRPESSAEEYLKNLSDLYVKVKKYSNKILFIDLTPVDENRTNPLPPEISSSGKSYANERIDSFNETLHKFCNENNLACVLVNKKFKENKNYQELLIDGLHPNTEGHLLMYESIKEEVGKLVKLATKI